VLRFRIGKRLGTARYLSRGDGWRMGHVDWRSRGNLRTLCFKSPAAIWLATQTSRNRALLKRLTAARPPKTILTDGTGGAREQSFAKEPAICPLHLYKLNAHTGADMTLIATEIHPAPTGAVIVFVGEETPMDISRVRFESLRPMLRTKDLRATIEFYTWRLGFTCDGMSEPDGWASLRRDSVRLMVAERARAIRRSSVYRLAVLQRRRRRRSVDSAQGHC
jgi:hypothetical protein